MCFKYGDTPLFEDLSFTVHAGHNVGLVGRNGIGKTTLFALIRQQLQPEDGSVEYPSTWRVSWLSQNVPPTNRSAIDFVMDGDTTLRQLQREIEHAQQSLGGVEIARALAEFEDRGGYSFESRAATILSGLGFAAEDHAKPHEEFSGGWRIRLNLAQTLMCPADLMLLDEPTNHLDLEAMVWFQKWLAKYEGTVLLIAHDRELLDQAVDTIVHIDQLQAFTYRGGYSSFEEQRAQMLIQQETMLKRQAQERERIQRFVDRFRAKASKARQVQSRIKMLERMTQVAVLRTQLPYRFSFQSPVRLDEPMVAVDNCYLGYDETDVIADATERIYPGDRIGVLGLNGAGKSTLLKALAGAIQPRLGSIGFSTHTTIGYFAQHQLEILDGERNARDHVLDHREFSEQQVRDFLGAWGFGGTDIFRPVRQFSGGEKARLVLAKIALERPALLVLDEPTNHLDMDMRAALSHALDSFQGAVVVVAHDQHLLKQCVNEFWLVKGGRVTTFQGNLDDYEAAIGESKQVGKPSKSSSKLLRKSRANARNQERDLVARKRQIESMLSQLELKVQDLNEKLVDPQSFSEANRSELQDWIRKHGKARKTIEELENEWMSIEERLDKS